MSEMPSIFPAPRTLTPAAGQALLPANARLCFSSSESPLLRHAAADINARLRQLGRAAAPVVFGAADARPGDILFRQEDGLGAEGYRLEITPAGIRAAAATDAGAFYAAQTLVQCLRLESGGVAAPAMRVEDAPDMERRGLFVEDKWGMDLMTLDDWKALVDSLSRLKLNILGVGAYGCWCIQYEGQVTEFLTLPIPEYPLLRTEKTIRYYSPEKGWQSLTYVPPLFEQDFFGELVAYGLERNVVVRPHFNSLGHNTLIPRLYPEVSARDAHGEPTGYGYCLTSPKTYEMIFRMYDGIIARTLRPHGVDYFHIGLDEVWPQIGADPRDPHRVVQPWCQCPECAKHDREELLIDFTARLCAHLKEQGIAHISVWNDQFARHMNIIDRLVAALKQYEVNDQVIVHWWHYGQNFPESLRPELGLRRWVTPMTGYYFWWTYQSYLQNIHGMLQLGARDGAVGAESYCSYDRAYDREITCLAEYAWRNNAGELDDFRRKYARFLFGDRAAEGERAFAALEAVCEPGELHAFLRPLFYYPYSYVNKSLPYPRHYPGERLRALAEDPITAREKLTRIREQARAAREGFLSLREAARQPEIAAEMATEAHRIEATAAEFLALLEAMRSYQQAVESSDRAAAMAGIHQAKELLNGILPVHLAMMRDVEQTKQTPLLPQTLRDLSAMWRALPEMVARLDRAAEAAKGGEALPGVEEVFLKQAAV